MSTSNNNVIRRDGGITQESYQRAKTLSHQYQVDLRKELKQTAIDKRVAVFEQVKQKVNKILQMNKACEDKLRELLGETSLNGNEVMFSNCSMDHFAKCTNDQCKAFIHAREFDSYAIPKQANWKWPKRDGLIMLAFERRSTPIKLSVPTFVDNPTSDAATVSIEPTVAS